MSCITHGTPYGTFSAQKRSKYIPAKDVLFFLAVRMDSWWLDLQGRPRKLRVQQIGDGQSATVSGEALHSRIIKKIRYAFTLQSDAGVGGAAVRVAAAVAEQRRRDARAGRGQLRLVLCALAACSSRAGECFLMWVSLHHQPISLHSWNKVFPFSRHPLLMCCSHCFPLLAFHVLLSLNLVSKFCESKNMTPCVKGKLKVYKHWSNEVGHEMGLKRLNQEVGESEMVS